MGTWFSREETMADVAPTGCGGVSYPFWGGFLSDTYPDVF